MEEVLFNCGLYVITLFVYFLIRRKFDIGVLLLSLYSIISICCVFYFMETQNEWEFSYWAFMYLYIIIMLFMRPFLFDTSLLLSKISINNIRFINGFIYLYCFCGVIDIYYGASTAIDHMNKGDWGSLRQMMYENEIALYKSPIERVAKILVGYLKPLAIVVLFTTIINKSISKKWIMGLAFSIIITSFLIAMNTASRGIVMSLAISFIAGFVVFKDRLPSKVKLTLYKFGFGFFVIVLLYSLAVTKSRFGEEDQSSSLLFYFGHSMLTFNYGIVDSIEVFSNGFYFFDWFVKILGLTPFDVSLVGTHQGTNFFTFVGAWYFDFGPNGTFILAIFVPLFFLKLIRKKHIDIADLFILFTFLNYLIMGVFVIGRGNAIVWVMSFIIYISLKLKKV